MMARSSQSPGTGGGGRAIGYLLKEFPVVSETFILNEVRAMESLEVPLVLLSLKRLPQRVVHRAVAELRSPLLYAPRAGLRQGAALLGAHLAALRARPAPYLRVVWRELGRGLRHWLKRPSRRRWRGYVKRWRRFGWAGWVAATARRRGIRHLHAHYATEPLRVARLAAKLGGLDFSFAAHAKDLYTAPRRRLARRLRQARFAVACHRHGAATLRELAGPEHRHKVVLVPHGIDGELFRPRTAEREPDLVLAVGRLTGKKGFDVLIRACGRLAAVGRPFRCEIRGEGKLRPRLQALVDRLGLDGRVRIRRFLSQEELPALYARAAVVALPCRELPDGNRDGVPNVVLEAMACGAPVVASRVAGLPEVVRHGVNGLLVPPDDPLALAAALDDVLSRPERAAELGREAAASVSELDFRLTNRRLAERFQEVLAAGDPRNPAPSCPASGSARGTAPGSQTAGKEAAAEEPALLRVEEALRRVASQSWSARGAWRRAAKRLGVEPRRDDSVETAIARAVAPGVAANGWRRDLERLATRRLWDEVYKAPRVPGLEAALNGSGRLPGPILDLGSGRGGLAVALRARGRPVVAFDLRYRNCAMAGWRGRRYGLRVPAVAGAGERLPFADASFGAVCCLEVLEHVQDPKALLAEIRRVLRPGGACAVTVINRWAHHDPHYHLWGINFLPRRLAARYIALRRRAKRSYRDRQTLDEMHYYSFGAFRRLAASLGFRLTDPETPAGLPARLLHHLKRTTSLGFTSALVVLRPA